MSPSEVVKIRHINYFFAFTSICLVCDAAAQLHDLHFLILNAVAVIAGYMTGPRWLDGDEELTTHRVLRVFWLPLLVLVILSLILIAGRDAVDRFDWLFIAQAVLAGRRLKSH